VVRFYHCKKSRGNTPGDRLDSVTELAAQIVKSVTWAAKLRIIENIRRRFENNIGAHKFVRGSLDVLEQLLQATSASAMDYEYIAVQPGLKSDGLGQEVLSILASASDYLVRGGFKPLRIICS
jgi:hypothetical protein